MFSGIVTVSAGDTLEIYYIIFENPVSGNISSGEGATKFGGFKLI